MANLQRTISQTSARFRFMSVAGITVTTLLFSSLALAEPACHKTAVCLMKQQEAKKKPPVEARTRTPAAPCSHKTAVCESAKMAPAPKIARPKADSKPAVPFCSHKTAVCAMQQAKAKRAQAQESASAR